MATLSSQPTKIHPLLPSFPADFTENLKNGKKSLWKDKGFVEASALFPICYMAPLPCKSVQSKHGIVQRSIRRKGQSFETIVKSCISRAVGFSTRQFKAILKSFSDSSARFSSSLGDVRCHDSRSYSNGPANNDNGANGNGGGGGGGGSGGGKGFSGEGGESVGGKPVMGTNWWRLKCQDYVKSGGSVLVTVAKQPQMYDHATSSWLLWVMEGIVQTAIGRAMIHLTEPAIEIITQGLLLPFQLFAFFLYCCCGELGNELMKLVFTVLVLGSAVAVVLIWLIWRWWRDRHQGLDEDGEDGDKGEDKDTI